MVPELKIFCGFCAKGQEFLHVRLRKVFEFVQRQQSSHSRAEGNHRNMNTKVKISLFIAENSNIPSTN
jgi:ribosomal protein L21